MAITFASVVDDFDLRVEVFLVLDHDGGDTTGGLVELALDGHAWDHIAEADTTGLFGKNRNVVRVPHGEDFALFDRFAVGLGQHRTNDNLVVLNLAIVSIEECGPNRSCSARC